MLIMNVMKSFSENFRSKRSDGTKTRKALLNAAGKVFAEKGYAETTSKEICARAKTNVAAVNYYFGGKNPLYEEVLVEAHKQLITLEDIEAIYLLDVPAEEKLKRFLQKLLQTAGSSPRPWGVKVFLREVLSPSKFAEKSLIPAVLPKVFYARKIIADVIGSDDASRKTQQALVFSIMPLLTLILFPEKFRLKVLPDVTITSSDVMDNLMRYTISGLKSLKQNL